MDKVKFNLTNSELSAMAMMVQEWLYVYEHTVTQNDKWKLYKILLSRLFQKISTKAMVKKDKYNFSMQSELALITLIHLKTSRYETVFLQNVQRSLIDHLAPKFETISI